ncbi:MAG: GTPase HflX, partial [Methylocystis sp.]|nr:GTPase HflX [Methylocystis sp.]
MKADSGADNGTTPNGAGARALVIGPYVTQGGAALSRDTAARLMEAVGLAEAIDLDVVGQIPISLNVVRPATYLGKGKVEEIGELVKSKDAALVSMDCQLSPVQQRNLERAWDAKVIDRTGLILEIFGERART